MTVPMERRLRVPADLDQLAEVRTLIREVAVAYGAPPTCLDDLVQAVDEAATTVIVHGERGRPGRLRRVRRMLTARDGRQAFQ